MLQVHSCDQADSRRKYFVTLYDHFTIKTNFGEHVCMVFEVLGESLLNLIVDSNYKGLPLLTVKTIIRQVRNYQSWTIETTIKINIL